MTATDERTGTPSQSRSPASASGSRRHRRRHENAVIQAELRRMARALGPSRALVFADLDGSAEHAAPPASHLSE